jgi:hypothetical protein
MANRGGEPTAAAAFARPVTILVAAVMVAVIASIALRIAAAA